MLNMKAGQNAHGDRIAPIAGLIAGRTDHGMIAGPKQDVTMKGPPF